MSLKDMTKEELELLSHKDITNLLLEENGKMNTKDIFKKITGSTIIEYVNREKVNLIKSYTSGNRMTLANASKLVGIDDCSYMSRLFKKVTGISYTQFQKLNDRKIN